MKTDLREFNDEGIRIFRDYLNKIKNNDMDQDFQELLSDSRYTTVITTASGIEPWLPPVKLEAAPLKINFTGQACGPGCQHIILILSARQNPVNQEM